MFNTDGQAKSSPFYENIDENTSALFFYSGGGKCGIVLSKLSEGKLCTEVPTPGSTSAPAH